MTGGRICEPNPLTLYTVYRSAYVVYCKIASGALWVSRVISWNLKLGGYTKLLKSVNLHPSTNKLDE